MTPEQTFADKVLERLGHEELAMKRLGLVNHAAGIRTAIVAVLKLLAEQHPGEPPLDSSPD